MILDTNALTALLVGDTALRRALNAGAAAVVPVVAIGEYLPGLPGHARGQKLTAGLRSVLMGSTILDIDADTAEHYAAIRHQLKLAGRPIPQNDVRIAALARQHAMPIVSRDKHFDHVPGVTRVGW